MSAAVRIEVRPGQTWRWLRPDGKEVEMFVERIQLGPFCARAYGYHTKSKHPVQQSLSALRSGMNGAYLVSEVDFVWKKARS